MIDTKIACQCGNRFKFDMDLVNGRAPDGMVCPSCGAPVTPACNALVDFLVGKVPPSLGTGSRPLKEIRVVCACGARYKFDLELSEQEMPAPVTCPGCQADLTATANSEIRSYVTKRSLVAETPAAPAVADTVPAPAPAASPAILPEPSPVAASTTPTPLAPAAALPVLPPSLVTPAAIAPDSPPAASLDSPPAAAATPDPKPSLDATAASTTTPTPATPAPKDAIAKPIEDLFSQARAVSVAMEGAIAKPIEDPFGPAPEAKTSGPKLKPLEVPRPNRPPPGSRPATPPAGNKPAVPVASAASAAPGARPSSGKPGSKTIAKPATNTASREPNFTVGVGGAVGGAVIGAVIWFVLLKATPMTAGWMAVVVGLLSGGSARLLGRGGSPKLSTISCVSSAVAIGLMIWIGMLRFSDRQAEKGLEPQYQQFVADAKLAIAADDNQLRAYIARTRPSADLDGNLITQADIQKFRATELPKLKERATGSAADKAKFFSERIAAYRDAQAWDEVWQETFGIFGLLLALVGIIVPAKLAG